MSANPNSKKDWTKGQSAAINIKGKTLLVSAAAGSGKTATLTERIIRSLTDKENPSDISKMLIVTFTRAAASELKERVFSALSEEIAKDPQNKRLTEQLIKLGSANICTIDSFCYNLVRRNFAELGVSATVRVGATAELKLLRAEIMNDVIEYFYDTDSDFPSFAECFIGTKNINTLADPLLELHESIVSYPEGVGFLKISADELFAHAQNKTDFFATSYGNILKTDLKKRFEHYKNVYKNALEHATDNEAYAKRIKNYQAEGNFVANVYELLSDENATFDSVKQLLNTFSKDTLGSVKKEDADIEGTFYQEMRSDICKDVKDLSEKLFCRTPDTLIDEMRSTADHTMRLYRLLSEFEKRLDEEKLKRNILDFNDIRRLAYKLLVTDDKKPTELAAKYAAQFSDIYIDEYQDVDHVQDLIFSSISNNNRFMVGDIKQSIYRFRGAEPKLFANYRKEFFTYDADAEKPKEIPSDEDSVTIFMSDNFRCDKNVIDFTNMICSMLFSSCAESIGYTHADDLNFSKKDQPDDYVSPKVEISVILTKEEDSENTDTPKRKKKSLDTPDNQELEAEYIAKKISELIGREKRSDGKTIIPGDIAIIYRSNSMVAYLAEALKKRGILCTEGGGGEYFENPDILLVLSLLNVVDNPHRDIHLAGVLFSPLYNFSFSDLILIRKNSPLSYSLYDALLEYAKKEGQLARKCAKFNEKLSALRVRSRALPVDKFLRVLFESEEFIASGLFADRSDIGDGGNLLQLYEYARTFESGSFKGLYNFIEFLNDLIEKGEKLETAKMDKSDDRVTLTTMHHSKGLEFPVCFICGAGKKKNTQPLSKSLLYEYSIGVSMKLSDETGFSRANTPMREAILRNKLTIETEEEMRVLYVALTRARERLYVTATSSSTKDVLLVDAEIRAKLSTPYLLSHCSSFLEWILIGIESDKAKAYCYDLQFITPSQIFEQNAAPDTEVETEEETYILPEWSLVKEIQEKFDFTYEYSSLTKIPAKLSVSRLYPDMLDENDLSVDLLESERKTRVPDFFIDGKPSRASAAERGTATHLFLQFCDFEQTQKHGVREELNRLVELKFIPQNLADIVYKKELEQFVEGGLAKRICSAEKILREQRFNLLLPAEAFSNDSDFKSKLSGEIFAVQGVIDLILINENGDIELYDYKTDRLNAEELASPELAHKRMNELHSLQLSYYAHAVYELFGKKCSRVCVYSTHAARTFDIDLVPLKLKNLD